MSDVGWVYSPCPTAPACPADRVVESAVVAVAGSVVEPGTDPGSSGMYGGASVVPLLILLDMSSVCDVWDCIWSGFGGEYWGE